VVLCWLTTVNSEFVDSLKRKTKFLVVKNYCMICNGARVFLPNHKINLPNA